MKTLEEIVETVRKNKRITKEEATQLYRAYELTCIKLNEAESKVKSLGSTNEMLRAEIQAFEAHTGERLHMPGGQIIFQKIRG